MESKLRLPLAAAFFLAIALFVLVATPRLGAGASGVVYTFDGAPASPKPYNPSDWDIAVSSRDTDTFYQPESMAALHGHDCGAPPLTHEVSTYEDLVYQCKDHVMTSILADGYGVIYLTPNQLLDFSGGSATFQWDSSTFRTTARDFLDIWITPWDDNQQLPMDDWLPDAQGEPKNAIHLRMDGSPGNTVFKAYTIRNFQQTEISGNWWTYMESKLTPDMKRRDTFEVQISRTHIKVGMPQYNLWWIDASFADLGWDQGVVQIGHHSYNPWKDGGLGPNTWHFDNVSLSPAKPFTMLKGNTRFVDSNGSTVNFSGAAPQGSHLRFSAVGKIEVSYNGGQTWSLAQRQEEELRKPEHFSSYWTPVPAGTASVMFRGGPDSWFTQWLAKDFAIWAPPGASSAPVPTNTPIAPTNTPAAPTNTPVAPTNTPLVSTTAVTSPTTVATSTPTSALPTATPTVVQPTATPVTPVVTLPQTSSGSRVTWQGQDWYLNGANLPWYNWGCDFGCNGNGGVVATKNTIATRLATAKAAGVQNLRWWLFPGDPWQVQRDANGMPTGINPAVYADIDAAIALAEQNNMYLTFTIFSAPSSLPADWLNDAAKREKLAEVLGTLFARYSGNSRILAWEAINEPEWDIWQAKAGEAQTVALVKSINTQVHTNSTALTTIGNAMLDGIPMFKNTGVDFYSPHWYDYMSSGQWCARCTDYAAVRTLYGIDAPVVIGEFYAGSDADALQRYNDFYSKGFAGAWAWSLFPERTADLLGVDLAAAGTFAASKSDDGPVAGATSPSTPTPKPNTPTATSTPKPNTPTPTSTPKPNTPTSTSTPKPATPAPTTPPSSAAVTWTSSAKVSTAITSKNRFVTISAGVKASFASKGLVDVEIYDPNGKLVYQKYWDDRSFTSNLERRFSFLWQVPSNAVPGTYTVKVGVFKVGWGEVFHWNSNAATIQVQ